MRNFSFSYIVGVLVLVGCGPKDPPLTEDTGDMTTKTSSESTATDTMAVTDSSDCPREVLTASICSDPLPDPSSSSSSSTTVSTTVTSTFDCAVETAGCSLAEPFPETESATDTGSESGSGTDTDTDSGTDTGDTDTSTTVETFPCAVETIGCTGTDTFTSG